MSKIQWNIILLLDDINAFKTFHVNQILKNDLSYQCLLEDYRTRNGFSIYKKIN